MAVANILAYLAFASAFFAAFSLSSCVVYAIYSRISSARVQERAIAGPSLWTSLVRNGVWWTKALSRRLIKHAKVMRFMTSICTLLREKGLVTTEDSVCSLCCAAIFGGIVLLFFASSSVVFACVGMLCIVVFLVAYVERQKEKRLIAIRETIPEALRSMSVCFEAGLSLLQTFKQVEQELDEPLASMFRQAAGRLEVGGTISDALMVFKSSSLEELAFIAVALDVQHEVGGSMQQILNVARESVESEIELRRILRVQTAQAKLSAHVVSIMPLILVAIFSFIAEDFLAPFFQSTLGLCLLGLACSMQVFGIFLVRKTLKVEVK